MMTAYRIWIRFAASALLVFWIATPTLAQHAGHAGGGGGFGGGGGMGRAGGSEGAPSAASRPVGHAAANAPSNRPAARGASSPNAAKPASTSATHYTPASSGMHLVPGVPTYRWQDPPSNASVLQGSAHDVVSPATNHQYFSAATGTSIGSVRAMSVPGRYPINTGCNGCLLYNPYLYNPYFPLGYYGGYGFGYGFGFGFGYGFGYGWNPFSPWNYGWGPGFGYGFGYGLGYYDNGLGYGDSSANTSSSGEYGPFASLDAKTNQPGTLPNPSAETTLVLKDGTTYTVTDYWMAEGKLHYVSAENGENSIDIDQVDLQQTAEQNSKRGVTFTLRAQDGAQPAQAPVPSQTPSQPAAEAPRP